MSELPNETWTSAYLDGELTAEERAQFERWLAANPAAQQLLDELRSVSQSVQALPRETLGPDFAKRVLERAELAVLLPQRGISLPIGEGTARPEHKRVELAASSPSTGVDWRRWSRPLLWSAMAAAAALMISFFLPSRLQRDNKMARLETKDSADRIVELSAPADHLPDRDGDNLLTSHPKSGERPMLTKEAAQPSSASSVRGSDAYDRASEAYDAKVQSNESALVPLQAKAAGEMAADEPLARNLVVLCEVTPQAADQNYFARVLERNRVSVDVVASSRESGIAAGDDVKRLRRKPAIAQEAAGVDIDKTAAQSSGRKQMIYVVEASQLQLTNVLADLQSDRADVLAVNVDPAPQIPAQQALTNFGRGYVVEQLYVMPANAAAMPAEVSEVEAQAPQPAALNSAEKKEPELEDAGDVPLLTTQSPAEAPEVEHPEPIVVPAAEDLLGRKNPQVLYSQNQIRQQIPIDEQRQLLEELKKLSAQPTGEAERVAEQSEKISVPQQGAFSNNSRARQVNLPQFRQIDANLELLLELPDVAQSSRSEPVVNRAKSAAERAPKEASGGGSPSKDGRRGRYSEQRQLNSQAQSAASAAQRVSPLTDEPAPSADKQEVDEPLVTAVFVIQAAPEVAGETAPANKVPAPNEAATPASDGPP